MTIDQASRKDIQAFHQWLKTLPWSETSFLYQTYMREETREQKLKDLFARFSQLTPEQQFPSKKSAGTPSVK